MEVARRKGGVIVFLSGMISGFLILFYNFSDVTGILLTLLLPYALLLGEDYYMTLNVVYFGFMLVLFISALYVHWRKRD